MDLDLDLVGVEDGAVIVSVSDYEFAFSEYVSKAWDRGRTVTWSIPLFRTEDVWLMNQIKYTEFGTNGSICFVLVWGF